MEPYLKACRVLSDTDWKKQPRTPIEKHTKINIEAFWSKLVPLFFFIDSEILVKAMIRVDGTAAMIIGQRYRNP
jgi:hypothetical protein